VSNAAAVFAIPAPGALLAPGAPSRLPRPIPAPPRPVVHGCLGW